jgi:Integrase zinc binding domain
LIIQQADSVDNDTNNDLSASQFIEVNSVTENKIDVCKGDVINLAQEQEGDETLKGCFTLLKSSKGEYFLKNRLLYCMEPVFGKMTELLVVPKDRRKSVLHLAHNMLHEARRKTRDRIGGSGLAWPTLTADCRAYASHCSICQRKARITQAGCLQQRYSSCPALTPCLMNNRNV